MWGIIGKFLLSGLLNPKVLITLAVIGVAGVIWTSGYNTARRQDQSETLKVEIEKLQRDAQIAEQQRIQAEQDAKDLEDAKAKDDAAILELQKQIMGDPLGLRRGVTQSELDSLHRLTAPY